MKSVVIVQSNHRLIALVVAVTALLNFTLSFAVAHNALSFSSISHLAVLKAPVCMASVEFSLTVVTVHFFTTYEI